jgi:pyrimidine deaminase RibD-like protein
MTNYDGHHEVLCAGADLARGGRFGAHPNPLVGAVVVREGAWWGGFSRRYAGLTRRSVPLAQGGERARGADLYVTLSPAALWKDPALSAGGDRGGRRPGVGRD